MEGSRWKSPRKKVRRYQRRLVFQFVPFVLHAHRARLRRLVCCFLSVANHCSGAIPCHNHCMFVALCVKKKDVYSNETWLLVRFPSPHNTQNCTQLSALRMHCSHVKWDVSSMLPGYGIGRMVFLLYSISDTILPSIIPWKLVKL